MNDNYPSSRIFDDERNGICRHMCKKGPNGRVFGKGKGKGKGEKERARKKEAGEEKKAMVALLVFREL